MVKTGTNMGCDCEARKNTESLLSSFSFGKRRKYITFKFPFPKTFHFRSTTATVFFFLSRSNGTETFGHGFKFHFDDFKFHIFKKLEGEGAIVYSISTNFK